jgi:hypothetical protein
LLAIDGLSALVSLWRIFDITAAVLRRNRGNCPVFFPGSPGRRSSRSVTTASTATASSATATHGELAARAAVAHFGLAIPIRRCVLLIFLSFL